MKKKQAHARNEREIRNAHDTNQPADIEDFASELTITSADTDTGIEECLSPETRASILHDIESKNIDDDVTTFPLTRTFVHCDSTGRELAHVSVTATVTLTRINGVTLTPNEIERRFRRNFHLSFNGGKTSSASNSAGIDTNATATRPRRTMSPEHKQKLQEARQRRRDGGNRAESEEVLTREVTDLASTLLIGFSYDDWRGKSTCLDAARVSDQPQRWSLAIRYLLDTAQIEARGEKRGREYRRVKATKGTEK